MAKLNKIEIKSWVWPFACVAFFFIGVIIGKIWFIFPTHIINHSNSISANSLIFNVPQVLLPGNWISKENQPGNSFATAYSLDPGIQTQGTLSNDNAIDYYTFNVKGPSQVFLNITNIPKRLYWVLSDSNYNEIASIYRKGVSTGSTQVDVQNPGKYYVKIWADYNETTNFPYAIRLSILPYFE